MVSKIFFFLKILKEHPKKPSNTDFQGKRVYHAPAMHRQRISFLLSEIAQKSAQVPKHMVFKPFKINYCDFFCFRRIPHIELCNIGRFTEF